MGKIQGITTGKGDKSLQESWQYFVSLCILIPINDFGNLLSRSNMLPLIIFSCIFGISVALLKEKSNNLKNTLEVLSEVMMKIVKIIMYYAPIGLCAYFANLVGEFGPELIGSYAKTMIFYYVMCILYFLIFIISF